MKTEQLLTILEPFFGRCGEIETQPGWNNLIFELHEKLLKIDSNYEINQIKEKFGSLRFYFSSGSEQLENMYKIVDEYEQYSETVCEFCGNPGKPAKFGWVFKTSCEKCLEGTMQKPGEFIESLPNGIRFTI